MFFAKRSRQLGLLSGILLFSASLVLLKVPFLAAAPPMAPAPVPLPRMIVPRTTRPPVIDGILEPGEWDRAAACTAFVKAFDGHLVKAQSTAWITYDNRYIYVAFRNYRAEQLAFLPANARRGDDDRIAQDPSNEIWISPPGAPAVTYQTVINSYPAVLDVKMIPSVGYSSSAWSGKWEAATRQDADSWTLEARAPIASFGFDRIEDGSVWRALFATDVLADPGGFRAWAPGGAFADIPRHGYLQFSDEGPAFQVLDVDSVFSGRPDISMAVAGPLRTSAKVDVTVRFGSRPEPLPGDVTLTKTVDVAAGTLEHVSLSGDVANTYLRSGYCEITAVQGNTTLYHQVFPFTVDGSVRRPPTKLVTTPYKQAFGLSGSYAPLSKKLLVSVDRYYMPDRKAVTGGSVRLIDPDSGRVVAESALAAFNNDQSEFALDLKNLTVPVETETDWARFHWQGAQGMARAGSTGVPPAQYRLSAVLTDKKGTQLAEASTTVSLMGYQFSWLPNDIGISDRVIPPWTPVRADHDVVTMWNKTYQLSAAGIATRITNAGGAQLSRPMALEAVVDGHRVSLSGDPPEIKKNTDAAAELAGVVRAPNLAVNTNTRVEFDGFVWNTMTVQPTKANVSELSLVITMPEEQGAFFVTTSGGWSSYFGDTPAKWDSRESSLPALRGNFVPYIFLTDSDRGFCWFADNEKGWRLDPALPTQEVQRRDGTVTLKVHFINKPGPIPEPMSIQYGWMVTPQKPQPAGWRGYLISAQKPYPQSTPVFWNDADWDVIWPYYSSPFPHDYEKSRRMLTWSAMRGVTGCVGQIAHAIARYKDFQGRQFTALAGDWGSIPGDLNNGNVARSRGPNDFDLFHFDRWAKQSGLGCLYFDENYISEDWNYLTGGAYLLPDGRVQPGYDYLGLREYNKRLRYMFYQNGKPAPNIWEHTTGGQAVYAWMPDVSMEGENVEPTDLTNDYIDALPASRIRSIGRGRNLGSASFIMCQTCRHARGEISRVLAHQLVGWSLVHDVLPEGVDWWPRMAAELELWRDDVRFVPYWRKGSGIESQTAGIIVSAHVRPSHAVLWVVNTNHQDGYARIQLDLSRLELQANALTDASDAETHEHFSIANGQLNVAVSKRSWRAIRIVQLGGG